MKRKYETSEQHHLRNYILNQARKRAFIELSGGVCNSCKKNLLDHPSCAVFHHLIPKEKKFEPNQLMTRNFQRSLKEIKKCILLCANCHNEIHFNNKRYHIELKNIIEASKRLTLIEPSGKGTDVILNKDIVLNLYKKTNSIGEVARELKVSRGPVRKVLQENNIQIVLIQKPANKGKQKISKEQITNLLDKGIWDRKKMAKILKCSTTTILNSFKNYNIPNTHYKERYPKIEKDKIIKLINDNPNISVSELARRLNFTRSIVSNCIKKYKINI